MATDRELLITLIDMLLEDIESLDTEEVDQLLRDAGIDPVALAAHFQSVADKAIESRKEGL